MKRKQYVVMFLLLACGRMLCLSKPNVISNVASYKRKYSKQGLVDISKINQAIRIDMRYATTNNFMHKKIYTSPKAYLFRSVAEKLSRVQKYLKKMGLGLKVWDAYRPYRYQFVIYDAVQDVRFAANPSKGSVHNRGASVDLTLVDKNGSELAMPTAFDDFTVKASSSYKKLSKNVLRNRELLKKVMRMHGFVTITTEWWHFNDKNWRRYLLLDIGFEDLG
mgnify:CR=1 FL=1|jgi:zinc D-Ala-D-Ala dipeptidase